MSQICPTTDGNWRTPETYVPTDDELMVLVRGRPLISLREICGSLWPGLPWRSASLGIASATSPSYTLKDLSADEPLTPAAWLRRRMLGLVARGAIRLGAFRRGEPQEAGITYYAAGLPEAAVACASQPGVVPIVQAVLDA